MSVGCRIVRVNPRARNHAAGDETFQSPRSLCSGTTLCHDFDWWPCHGCLATATLPDRPSACQYLSLGERAYSGDGLRHRFHQPPLDQRIDSLYDHLGRAGHGVPRCQADFCVMPKSRWSFMLDTLLRISCDQVKDIEPVKMIQRDLTA